MRDKFTPEMKNNLDLMKRLEDHFLKTKKMQKFIETGDSRYIYQNELDKPCYHNDMAYGHFKDLSRKITTDKVLCDKAFNIAKNSI